MKIFVTSDDIKKGASNDAAFCPVAIALSKIFREVRVEEYVISFAENDRRREIKIPRSVERFIGRFDNDKKVSPFVFEI